MRHSENPYETLRCPVLASEDEIVARGVARMELEASEERKRRFRAAVEALTTHPQEAAYYKFWEPAGTAYEHADEEAFLARYGAEPVEREPLGQRARSFLAGDCAAVRLLDDLIPGPRPPSEFEECDPGSAPQTPLRLAIEPREWFV